jgi:hypothetical protein
MRYGRTLLGAALVAGCAALPLTSASAAPCNPVTGVFGAAATVAGAAVTIGTAPLVILAGDQPRFHDYTCGDRETRDYTADVTYEGPTTYGPPPAQTYYDERYDRTYYGEPPPPPPEY